MPKENKHSRGRRDEKKLKRKRDDEEETPRSKKQKSQEPVDDVVITGTDNADVLLEDTEASERPFYGMLEDEEQEYFRRADELLELNDFPSEEERSIFLANVYKEADGKELKIACSQGCSRLMERLILLSSTAQKKKLFEKFAGNYPHLIQHRFASHCCETLFIQSAPVITGELTADSKKKGEEEEVVEEEKSMETLFLETLDELEGQMTFLLTDRFASHTLRVLLVILSGRPLEKSSTRTLMQSKKKEKITVTGYDNTPTELSLNKRAVPSSFEFAVEKIISDTIATMDTSFIRVLATHPTGNPTLQLLLELELSNPNSKKGSNSDQKTIISALLPDEITKEGSESQTFINGLLYEPIGSRLLETICTFAPGKLFKQVYRAVFKDRIAAIARNEISSYAAIRVLNRLSKEDLQEALDAIYPQIAGLIERKRTVIVKTLLERCQVRGVDSKKLVQSIAEAYGSEPSSLILKMACIDDVNAFVKTQLTPPPTEEETAAADQETEKPKRRFPQAPPKAAPSQLHGSLLAQGMLAIPGSSAKLIQTSLLALPSPTLLALAMYTTTSHIIQAALLPNIDVLFRRKFINLLLFASDAEVEHVQVLALSSTGSHVLDALLTSTTAPTLNSTSAPIFSLSERIANVLITHEFVLRNSWSGRIVWRNWNMDLFKRRRGDWVNTVKAAGAEKAACLASFLPEPVVEQNGEEEVKVKKNDKKIQKGKGWRNGKGGANPADEGKSAIQLAREKFAAAKANKIAMKDHRGTGVNASAVVGRS